MRRRALIVLLAGLATALVLAAPAGAEIVTKTFRTGPITVAGYQVKQNGFDGALNGSIPTPDVDGFIVGMDVDIVDADGTKVPIRRLMLHHIVFANLGRRLGEKHDRTCSTFTGLDSKTKIPALAERFFAAGEERAKLGFPAGYGYRIDKGDTWFMTWMLMNHRKQADTAYIQYHVTVDTNPSLTATNPYWLDVKNCLSDPVFDAPGGGRPGSTFSIASDFRVPESGRIVAGGGHVHGGAKDLTFSEPDCGDRTVYVSRPAWGTSDNAFYNVKPVLHEPGPIAMSGFISGQGYPVARGQRLRVTARYDDARTHTRAMGIGVVFIAPDPSVAGCGPPPDDVFEYLTNQPHRKRAPRFTVPLIGLNSSGRAVEIAKPPGRVTWLGRGGTIEAGDLFFRGPRGGSPNVAIPTGATLRWRFDGSTLHNVTVANGPRGFSSRHLSDGRVFKERFKRPGTYKIFCALHPVSMTQVVEVRAKSRSRARR